MKKIAIIVVFIAAGYLVYQNFFNALPEENMMFTLNNCELCDIAKDLMDAYEIEYTEYNVEESDETFALFKKYKGKTLPMLIIEGERIAPQDETFLHIAFSGLFEPDSHDVLVYTETGCGWCKKTIAFFQDNDVEFSEYNIRESPEYRSEFEALGGVGVPFVVIGDIPIAGYNLKAYRAALKQLDLI